MTKTTYTASYTTADGQTITQNRTSHRTYTHAAVYNLGDGPFIGSFHSSADLAAKGSDFRPIAVVPCHDIKATEPTAAPAVEIAADTRCDGLPAAGQGARLQKKCSKCSHVGSARAWRKHTAK